MKSILIGIYCLLSLTASAQLKQKDNYAILSASLSFVSGSSNGLIQTTSHHYSSFEERLTASVQLKKKYNWKHAVLPASLSFASGLSNGLNQTISHHYWSFKEVFPNANDQYWKPELSSLNKYEGRDKNAGPAYFGSTTFLAWTTDGYHLTNTLSRGTLFAAGVCIGLGEKRPWWHYALDIGVSFISYSAGFHLVYSGVF